MGIVPVLTLYDVQFYGLISDYKKGEFRLLSFKEIVDIYENLMLGF